MTITSDSGQHSQFLRCFLQKLAYLARQFGGAGWCSTFWASYFTCFGTQNGQKQVLRIGQPPPILGKIPKKCRFFLDKPPKVTLCSSQYRTVSSIPIGSPFSMSALLRICSINVAAGERPGGHLAIVQRTQHSSASANSNSSNSSGSRGGGCAPPGAGEE